MAKKHQELPESKEAEQIILGSMLQNESEFWRLCDRLRPEHFSDKTLASIYRNIAQLAESGRAINPLTVAAVMDPESDTGISIVSIIQVAVLKAEDVEPALISDYLDALIDSFERRVLINGLEAALNTARDLETPVSTTIMSVDQTLTAVSGGAQGSSMTLAAAVDSVMRDVEQSYRDGVPPGVSTGLISLDGLIGTCLPGDLIVIFGEPGSGKTALAMQIAKHISDTSPEPSMFFSLEMGAKQIAARELASAAGVPVRDVRRAHVDAADMDRLLEANLRLSSSRLELRTGIKALPMIRLAALRQRKMTGISALFLDHAMLVKVKGNPKIFELVTEVANAMKDFAKELGCPVFLLAQRGREGRNTLPAASDVMGGSTIEQAADVLLAVHRREVGLIKSEPSMDAITEHEKWSAELRQWKGLGEVFCLKLRDGPANTVCKLNWNGPLTRYEER